jgi:hypothetical protein
MCVSDRLRRTRPSPQRARAPEAASSGEMRLRCAARDQGGDHGNCRRVCLRRGGARACGRRAVTGCRVPRPHAAVASPGSRSPDGTSAQRMGSQAPASRDRQPETETRNPARGIAAPASRPNDWIATIWRLPALRIRDDIFEVIVRLNDGLVEGARAIQIVEPVSPRIAAAGGPVPFPHRSRLRAGRYALVHRGLLF